MGRRAVAFAWAWMVSQVNRVDGQPSEAGQDTVVSTAYERELAANLLRKERYRKPCPKCGRLMTGCNGRTNPPSLCAACSIQEQRDGAYWTDERVLAAAREWHLRFGKPPLVHDWKRAQVIDGYRFPPFSACYHTAAHRSYKTRPWKSWRAFLEAAGFESVPGGYERKGTAGLKDAAYHALQLSQRVEGVTVIELSRARGTTGPAGSVVLKNLLRRGLVTRHQEGKAYVYTAVTA